MNEWRYIGTVEEVTEKKVGQRGNTVSTVRLAGKADDNGNPAYCVCETWGTAPEVGAKVEASGFLKAREWQGRWYGAAVATEFREVAEPKPVAEEQTDNIPF